MMESIAYTYASACRSQPCSSLQGCLTQSINGSTLLSTVLFTSAAVLAALPGQASVSQGDRCDAVADVQLALAELGYRPGSIDGVFGPATRAAVIRFQTAQSLTPDGVVGPETANRLRLGDANDPGDPFRSGNGCGGSVTAEDTAAPAPAPSLQTYQVLATALNIRSGPGVEYPVVGVLYEGELVQGRDDGEGWVVLDTDQWVSASYVTPVTAGSAAPTPTPTATGTASSDQIRVTATALNVRSGPGLEFPIVGTLVQNEVFPTSGAAIANGWVQLAWGDWVAADYVTFVKGGAVEGGASPNNPPAQPPVQEVIANAPRNIPFVVTAESGLRLRSSPNGEVVGSVPNGAQVFLSGNTAGDWVELTDGNWVAGNWLDQG